jgi:isochorismate synthase
VILEPTRGLVAPDPAAFIAHVSPLTADDPVPIGAAATDGHLVAGRTTTVAALGSAAVLGLPSGLADPAALRAVSTWLRSVERRGTGAAATAALTATTATATTATAAVTAVGAFPFDPSAPATLVVPASAWTVDTEGRGWRVDVRRRGGPRPPVVAPVGSYPDGGFPALPGPGTTRLTAVPAGREYAGAVARAVADITAGRIRKVVLSRSTDVRLPRAPAPYPLMERLWGADPAFRPYSVPVGDSRMVGASPELLVARHGANVASHAFAGTIALADGDERAVDRLLASAKDRDEHRVVVEAIASALGPRCERLDVPPSPSVVRLRSDARLGTLLSGTLRHGDTALELLGLLHPTPAVAGMPRPRALELIDELEPPRGYWAGAVGWVDAAGDGCWLLAIRCAILEGARAIVRAGAGIVEGSDPQAELAETTVKLSPVLEALWPGASTLL